MAMPSTFRNLGRRKLKEPVNLGNLENGIDFVIDEDKETDSQENNAPSAPAQCRKRLFCPLKPVPIFDDNEPEGTDDNSQSAAVGPILLPLQNFEDLLKKYQFKNVTSDGGIMKYIRRRGKTPELPPENAVFWIKYKMMVEHSDEYVFKSVDEEPFKFQRYQENIMPWLDYCVSKMNKGEISYFIVNPKYGYGENGVFGVVPKGALILYEIELFHYYEAPVHPIKRIFEMSPDELNSLDITEIIKYIKSIKSHAEMGIKAGDWSIAISKYEKGLKVLEAITYADDKNQNQIEEMIFNLYCNSAVCFLKIEDYETLKFACETCLEIDEKIKGNRAKVYYLLASAEFNLVHYEKAFEMIQKARALLPCNTEIFALNEKIQTKLAEEEKVSYKLYRKMSKFCSK